MVYPPTCLKNLSIADLNKIQITYTVNQRDYGRRFTAIYEINGIQYTTDTVPFHTLFLKAHALAMSAIKNQNLSELELAQSFTAKLNTANLNANNAYQTRGFFYEICKIFHKLFGSTPWFSSHQHRVAALSQTLSRNIEKTKDLKGLSSLENNSAHLKYPDTISEEWLSCLKNKPKATKHVDILNHTQTFPFEKPLNKLLKHDPTLLKEMETHAKNTHTLIDTPVHKLFFDFLENKCSSGSPQEKKLYQNMMVEDFVERLLSKRPLSFSSSGVAFLRDRKFITNYFEKIGTDDLNLNDYLSLEEIQLSAFLVTATPTHFINQGEFDNIGNLLNLACFQRQGIYYGLSGADLTNPNYMEEELVCIKPDRLPNLYYPFLAFFGGFNPFVIAEYEYNDNPTKSDYYLISENCYLDKTAYKKIMQVRISAFLKDANNQAKALGKMAYLHVIPLLNKRFPFVPNLPLHSLLSTLQQQIYQEQLEKNQFTHIDTLHFNSFPELRDIESFGSVKIKSSFRNPADKLDDDNLLLCAQYESNPNSFPGNWYWHMKIGSEGSPPALCSTIADLQNPLINENSLNLFVYK